MSEIDTTNVVTAFPSPAGEGPSRVVKDRTATARKRRSRANKRKHRDTPVTLPGHGVTAPVTLPVARPAGVDLAAYTVAIGLASVAALFSVKGMVQLFPGAPLLISAMAAMVEAGKLVTAGWLARHWRATAWVWGFRL